MNGSIPNNTAKANISLQNNPFSIIAWTSAAILLVLAAPALSVIVFLRDKFGCRYIKIWMLWICFGLLWTVGSLYAKTYTSVTPARVFAVAMLGLGVFHHRRALKNFWDAGGGDGKPAKPELLWHTMNDGDSWIRRFFPNFFTFKRERLLKVVIEPGLVGGVGLLCVMIGSASTIASFHGAAFVPAGTQIASFGPGLVLLSYWLFFAAFTLATYEAMLYEERLNRYMDFIDEQVNAIAMIGANAAVQGKQMPKREDLLGSPAIFTPDLFKIMEAAREKAEQANASAEDSRRAA